MTKTYEKRLVELAKEVMRLGKPRTYLSSTEDEESVKFQIKMDEMQYESRLNFLLGFIVALDEKESSEIEWDKTKKSHDD